MQTKSKKAKRYVVFALGALLIFGAGIFALVQFSFFYTSQAGHGPKHMNIGSDMDIVGQILLGRYSTKPSCVAANLASLVFDTTIDKPFVCASSGWKPLDSDNDKDGLVDWFDPDDNSPNPLCSADNGGECFITQPTKSALDTDLVSSNIQSGVEIFGVAGTAAQVACGGVDYQRFTTPGTYTWTKPAGVTFVKVWLIGGGGGGGSQYGAGGGGGSVIIAELVASTLGSTETVVVGAGGIGGTQRASGTSGGASRFAGLNAGGGGGGGGGLGDNFGGSGGSVSGSSASGGTPGVNGGNGANGPTPYHGGGGGASYSVWPVRYGGNGGNSIYGGGGGGGTCAGGGQGGSTGGIFGAPGGSGSRGVGCDNPTAGNGGFPGGGGGGTDEYWDYGGNGGGGEVRIWAW